MYLFILRNFTLFFRISIAGGKLCVSTNEVFPVPFLFFENQLNFYQTKCIFIRTVCAKFLAGLIKFKKKNVKNDGSRKCVLEEKKK